MAGKSLVVMLEELLPRSWYNVHIQRIGDDYVVLAWDWESKIETEARDKTLIGAVGKARSAMVKAIEGSGGE